MSLFRQFMLIIPAGMENYQKSTCLNKYSHTKCQRIFMHRWTIDIEQINIAVDAWTSVAVRHTRQQGCFRLFPINSSNAVFINSHRATALAMLRYHGFDHTYSMKNHLSYGSDQRLSTPRRCWFFEEKDLGVLITSNLKPAMQCQQPYAKANRALGLITRTITYKHPKVLIQLQAIERWYAGPHLEYCISAVVTLLLNSTQLNRELRTQVSDTSKSAS